MSGEQKKYITKIIKTETASGDSTPVDVNYYIKDSEARDGLGELKRKTDTVLESLGDLSSSNGTVSERLDSIDGDISGINISIKSISSSVKSVESGIKALKTEDDSIKGRVGKLETDSGTAKNDISAVEEDINNNIKPALDGINANIVKVESDIEDIKEDITDELPKYTISKKYSELYSLVSDNQLKSGQKYRIIDYVTKVNGENINSAGHGFDIIVEAISESQLSEDAKVCLRKEDEDTYFAESKSNLDAWEIKYCIKNDTSRFSWATSSGKGVIYWMKDEFGNEAPYDFKNIQFKSISNLPSLFANDLPESFSIDGIKNENVYTFHHAYIKKDKKGYVVVNEDASLNKHITCKLNKIDFNYLDVKTRKDAGITDKIDEVRSSHYLYSLLDEEGSCLVLPRNVIYILHCLEEITIDTTTKTHTFKNVCMVGNQFLNNCNGIGLFNLDGSNILENGYGIIENSKLCLLSSNICNNTFNNCQDITSFLENNTAVKVYINHYLNGLSSNQFKNSRDIVLQCNGDLCNNIFENSYHIDLATEINDTCDDSLVAIYGIDDNSFINSKYINIHGSYKEDYSDDYGYCLYTFIGKNNFNNCDNFRILHTNNSTLLYDDFHYNTIENNNFNFSNFRLIFGGSSRDSEQTTTKKDISILNSSINIKNTTLKLIYLSNPEQLDYPCINNIRFNINSIKPDRKFKCVLTQTEEDYNFIRILNGSFSNSGYIYSCTSICNEDDKVSINYHIIDESLPYDISYIKRKLIGESVYSEIGIEDEYIDSDNTVW